MNGSVLKRILHPNQIKNMKIFVIPSVLLLACSVLVSGHRVIRVGEY